MVGSFPKFNTIIVQIPASMVHNGKVVRKTVKTNGLARTIKGTPSVKLVQKPKVKRPRIISTGTMVNRSGEATAKKRGRPKSNVRTRTKTSKKTGAKKTKFSYLRDHEGAFPTFSSEV